MSESRFTWNACIAGLRYYFDKEKEREEEELRKSLESVTTSVALACLAVFVALTMIVTCVSLLSATVISLPYVGGALAAYGLYTLLIKQEVK